MSSKHDRYKSKYTADRANPGGLRGRDDHAAEVHDGQRKRRRRGGRRLVHPPRRSASRSRRCSKAAPHRWEVAGPTDMFPDDNYIPVVITLTPGIGQVGKTTVYVRKHNACARHRQVRPRRSDPSVHRDLGPLRARGLPRALGARRGALRMPMPRRCLRHPRTPRRRAATASARPLLHAREQRKGRTRPALLVQQRAAALLAARSRRAARRDRPVPLPGPVRRTQVERRGDAEATSTAAALPR